jgi:hypothetical protein
MRRVEADATSGVHGALKLGEVVRTRECLLSTSLSQLVHHLGFDECVDEARTTERSLLHDGGVAELLDKSLTTLDCGVRDLSVLAGAEARPRATLQTIEQGDHAIGVGEVDEGIAHVAARLEIYAEVQEVVCAEADIVEDSL